MFKTIGYTVVLALALSAPGVHAQASKKQPKTKTPVTQPEAAKGAAGVGKGDSEFGVFGNYTTYDDQDFNLLLIGVSLGKFLSDTFEFRISPTFTYVTGSQGGSGFDSYAFAPVFSGEFLFRNASRSAPVVPFIGAGIGINLGYTTVDAPGASDTFDYGISLGPTAGLKYFLSERTSLELALTYLFGVGQRCDDVDCYSSQTDTLQQVVRFNFYY